MHTTPHPLARQTIAVPPDADDGGPSFSFRVEDWGDRVLGRSWRVADGLPVALVYALRVAEKQLPLDDDVVYGHDATGFAHLIHSTEITGGAS